MGGEQEEQRRARDVGKLTGDPLLLLLLAAVGASPATITAVVERGEEEANKISGSSSAAGDSVHGDCH
jgi:hypothetical protein